MNNVLVDKQDLSNIGDAIRSLTGEETKYKPKDMAPAILSLSGGG